MKAEKVYINAKIYSISLDDKETRAQALAIKDGKFIYIGDEQGIKDYIDENTIVVDCNGGSILPGFGDAHMHFGFSYRRFESIDLYDLVKNPHETTPDEVIKVIQERIKDYVEKHPDEEVIHGTGFDKYWFLGELKGITRKFTCKDIDEVVSDKPVVLDSNCGHVCLLNSAALKAAGLDKNTPDPKAGIIRRFEDGSPDGYIQEPVLIRPVCMAIPGYLPSDERVRRGMLKAQDQFASLGYTYICDCMEEGQNYSIIKDMAQNNQFKMRIDGVLNMNDYSKDDDYRYILEKKGSYDVDDIFKVDTVKYFVDGEYAMCEPYTDEYCDKNNIPHGSNSVLLWNKDNLMNYMQKVQEQGFNIHVHAMGDYAVRYTIECYLNAKKYDKTNNLRNIIAHCTFVKEEDKKLMGENGIIASIQPKWTFENNKSSTDIVLQVGEERHSHVYPVGSLMANNVVCAFGSDYCVDLPNALNDIQMSMTRKATRHVAFYSVYKDFEPDIKEECISLKQAIKAHTINVAYQFHREDITGSIELGKSADFVVLDNDIEKTPINKIVDMQVIETVFKGNTTFKK